MFHFIVQKFVVKDQYSTKTSYFLHLGGSEGKVEVLGKAAHDCVTLCKHPEIHMVKTCRACRDG